MTSCCGAHSASSAHRRSETSVTGLRVRRRPLMRACLVLLAACATTPDDPGDPQLPARGADPTTSWLAAGYYLSWHCEAAGHASRPPSPHPRNRTCNNDAIRDTPAGAFPVGAASVKELLDEADHITGFAVDRKTGDGEWYWYEASGADVIVAEQHSDGCVNC